MTLSGEVIEERNCRVPKNTILRGKHVTLHSTQPEHLLELYEATNSFTSFGPYESLEAFRESATKTIRSDQYIMFSLEDHRTNKFAGIESYTFTSPTDGIIEIGMMFVPALRKTVGATETFYLLAKQAFEVGCRRLEWRCDDNNEGSKRAAVRFGFTFEGVFRQHRIFRGKSRNTAVFSMLDSEWPAKKAALEMWMDPANFDESGVQRQTLLQLQQQIDAKSM